MANEPVRVQVGEVISRQQSGQTVKSTNTSKTYAVTDTTREAVAELWRQLSQDLGALFTKVYGPVGGPAFENWCVRLHDLTPAQIAKGLARYCDMNEAEATRFRLSARSFRSLCLPLPGEFGLPGADEAYREACMKSHNIRGQQWSHPAVYLAASKTGWFDIRTSARQYVFPRFERYYEAECKRVMAGEDLSYALRGLEKHDDGVRSLHIPSPAERLRGSAVLAELKRAVAR